MTGQKQNLIVRVEPSAKAAFVRRAKKRGMTESELLRALVMAELDLGVTAPVPVEPESERLDTERMTVRMAGFLWDAVKDQAKAKGMAPSRWVSALVQSNVTGLPVLTETELSALQGANRELAAIGRNINQIARRLNEGFHESERERLDKLAHLSENIVAHRQAIRNLVRASQQAWQIEGE